MPANPPRRAAELLGAGRFAEAEKLLGAWCAEHPDSAASWFLLGACRHALKTYDVALAALERAIALDPADVQSAVAVLAVLCEAGRPRDAVVRCGDFLARHPGDARLRFSAGVACEQAGDRTAALDHYDGALAIDPALAGALQNRGILLIADGRIEEAVANNRRFAQLHPRLVDAHYNLAESCLAARRYDDAVAAAGAALQLRPDHVPARLDLGLALAALGRLEEARPVLREVVSRNDAAVRERVRRWAVAGGLPEPVDTAELFRPEDIFVVMGCERLERCDWDGLERFTARCAEMLRAVPPQRLSTPAIAFKLLYLPLEPALQRNAAERVAAAVRRRARALPVSAPANASGHTRVRIGYLSPGFGHHATAHLTRSMYAMHDRTRFEVFGYSLAADDGSDQFREIASACDRFATLPGAGAGDIAQRIARDGIDILVDLGGYTDGSRPQVLALRPAPVQVSFLAYPATLGGALADYILLDDAVAPRGSDAHYSERVVRLPHSYFVASHRAVPDAPSPSRESEGLPSGDFVFCGFNRHEKIEPGVFSAWMRILCAVPESVLWLLQGPGEANLRRRAADAGVDPTRLVFARRQGVPQHLARQRLADLFLDTHVCNAHTTGLDALWAGVPMITFPGEHLVSRVGASLLRAIGLGELVTDSFERYEALAVEIGTHHATLRALKERLSRNRESSPLFDVARSVRAVERAYREMWRLHEAGEPPRAFDVPETVL